MNKKVGYCEDCEHYFKASYMSSNPDKCMRCDAKLEDYCDHIGIYVYLSPEDKKQKKKTYMKTDHPWEPFTDDYHLFYKD